MITLRVREPVAGADDPFGNTTNTWAERDWVVRSIAPGAMEPGPDRARDLSLIMWTVYADPDGAPTDYSQVKLPGDTEWYEVEGRPADWTMGPARVGVPSGPVTAPPGVVVELRRADG